MEQFIRVRIVQGNGMDLSLFQFDYDLTFAVFFMNADKTIYGRFGTRAEYENAAKDISIEGFKGALEAALALHEGYPENKETLTAKTGPDSIKKTPEAFPALLRYSSTLDFNSRINQQCIHCHQIGEAQREIHWYDRKPVPDEVLYPFPMPDVLGLHFSPKHRAKISKVTSGSSAEKDGFRRADEILTLDGQPIISIADVQWVLHRASENTTLSATVDRHGEKINLTLTLNPGWRKGSDISWRTTTGELRLVALGGMVLQDLSNIERQRNGIGETEIALNVERVNRGGRRSSGQTNAERAGIRRGDIVIAYGDRTDRLTESGIIGYVLQDAPQAKTLPIKLLRNGEQIAVELSLD
ncbi:peptidase [Candidatus Poribacteria bacterium]|nr:MAG: peptidase [Candidatus Poribacteria bacterium]